MKKIRLFFMTILVAITLLGFSGTSYAFDLSVITEKPVKFAKYIAKKLGFGDSDEEKPQQAESEKNPASSKSENFFYYTDNNTEPYNITLYAPGFSTSAFKNEFHNTYRWKSDNEDINLIYESEDWHLKIGSRTGEIFAPFSYKSPDVPVWQTRIEYSTNLPWESFSQISTELFLESAFSQQRINLQESMASYGFDETFNLSQDNLDYGIKINANVKDAKIGLYGWYGDDANPLNPAFYSGAQEGASDYLWSALNSSYYQASNNLAATISYDLPFMSFFHQGMSPTIRFETAYRFGATTPENNDLDEEDYDQLKVGMAYEGKNRINWLNPYGINWGVGYNYTVTLDELGIIDNFKQGYGSHSGNIKANTYWFNMKLYTMFMYLYDRETRGSMTVLNATYSPDWRWSYGIRANFYYGKKDEDGNDLKDKSELVTFTATYRWD